MSVYPSHSDSSVAISSVDSSPHSSRSSSPRSVTSSSFASHPHPHPPHSHPQRVGDWYLGSLIGSGSFGTVRLGVHHKTREQVAIKIVEKSSIANVEDVERVYRETFILTTLKHPNIIKLLAVIDSPHSIMLVMEYAAGGDCFSYISALQPPRLSELEACKLFQQMLSGVEYCHRAKIIHRDLKLENILLSSSPSSSSLPMVKIADFGLSNSIKFSNLGTHCGTPSYTAPENIQHSNAKDGEESSGNNAACDLWALGVILFAMLCGFLPFEAPSVPQLFKRIRGRLYRPPSWISAESRDLIDSLLTIDPNKRATLSEVRSHPWIMMDYNPELCERIAQLKPPTKEMIEEARMESMNAQEARVNSPIGSAFPGSPTSKPLQSPLASAADQTQEKSFNVDQFLAAQVQTLLAAPQNSTSSLIAPTVSAPPRDRRAASFSVASSGPPKRLIERMPLPRQGSNPMAIVNPELKPLHSASAAPPIKPRRSLTVLPSSHSMQLSGSDLSAPLPESLPRLPRVSLSHSGLPSGSLSGGPASGSLSVPSSLPHSPSAPDFSSPNPPPRLPTLKHSPLINSIQQAISEGESALSGSSAPPSVPASSAGLPVSSSAANPSALNPLKVRRSSASVASNLAAPGGLKLVHRRSTVEVPPSVSREPSLPQSASASASASVSASVSGSSRLPAYMQSTSSSKQKTNSIVKTSLLLE